MHGAGSPQAMRVMLLRETNLEQKKQLAKHLAKVKGGAE
jgi:4-hydroxybutyryl-CoA dehydratase/vinylacetyl-CoA-Delta-isomerase